MLASLANGNVSSLPAMTLLKFKNYYPLLASNVCIYEY